MNKLTGGNPSNLAALTTDLMLLRSHIERVLWTIRVVRVPWRNPNFYVEQAMGALIEALVADADQQKMDVKRVTTVVDRLSSITPVLAQGRANLTAGAGGEASRRQGQEQEQGQGQGQGEGQVGGGEAGAVATADGGGDRKQDDDHGMVVGAMVPALAREAVRNLAEAVVAVRATTQHLSKIMAIHQELRMELVTIGNEAAVALEAYSEWLQQRLDGKLLKERAATG
jgi:hypothetical protein